MVNDTLTGITKTAGTCADCSRELTVQVFTVRNAEGVERDLGRRCAVKATGYSKPDRESARIARIALTDGRRAELIAAGATDECATYGIADAWWNGRTATQIVAQWNSEAA